jgi:hypothetical protein
MTDIAPHVDLEVVEISKGNREEVEWKLPSTAHEARLIKFANSPFKESQFVVPVGDSVFSGPAMPNAVIGKHYKYSVCRPNGTVLSDPEVVIIR